MRRGACGGRSWAGSQAAVPHAAGEPPFDTWAGDEATGEGVAGAQTGAGAARRGGGGGAAAAAVRSGAALHQQRAGDGSIDWRLGRCEGTQRGGSLLRRIADGRRAWGRMAGVERCRKQAGARGEVRRRMSAARRAAPLAAGATHARARTRPALETAWAISSVLTVSYWAAGPSAGASLQQAR